MATMNDIANKLGVSKGTVSKAFSDAPDISESLRKTILETAVAMGYTRSNRKRTVAQKLCILIENMDFATPSHFGYDIILGFRQMAEPAGYSVEVIPVTEQFQKKHPYDEFMLANDYVGAFCLGLSLSDPWIKEFQTSRTPAVLYDNYVTENPNVAYVGVDNNEGLDLAVAYLKKAGHKKIGYLSGALGSYINQVRHKAFFHALRQNGLPSESTLSGASYHVSDCLHKYLPQLLKQDVTAIICSHDLLAHALMIQCQESGLRIPDDLSIIGFDDLPFCAYTMPPLSTIRQNRPQLGKSAYYALYNLMNQIPISTLLLHAELILRDSTRERR